MARERLQKIIASRGLASRRAAEQWIAEGRVTVNGEVVQQLGSTADPDCDDVCCDGIPLPIRLPPRVIMLNKPAGYLSTCKKSRERGREISELIPSDRRYFPVGRLDRDSTGLLLLTDDGEFAHRVAHPRHGIEKAYLVGTRDDLSAGQIATLLKGIPLEEGIAKIRRIEPAGHGRYRLILTQGMNRQIRRMIKFVGSAVTSLHREALGTLELGDLRPGMWRELSEREVEAIAATARGDSPETS